MEELPFELGKTKITIAKPKNIHQQFECFPMRIDASGLFIICCIENQRSGWWEDWDLSHLLSGIKSGFYKVEASETTAAPTAASEEQ